MNCIIREVSTSDCNALAHLMASLGNQITSADMLERIKLYQRDQFHKVLVAVCDGVVIGCIAALVSESFERKGRSLRVMSLVVNVNFRRQGIETLLIESVEAFAIARECGIIELATGGDHEADVFYKALGYREAPEAGKLMVKKLAVIKWI